jgi:hypothetical protein
MQKFVRGILTTDSRDFLVTKVWLQGFLPNVIFMPCDDGYYFEVPIDSDDFDDEYSFYEDYLKKQLATTTSILDFRLYGIIIIRGIGSDFCEVYMGYSKTVWGTPARNVKSCKSITTVRQWLKWDKLHKEYNK